MGNGKDVFYYLLHTYQLYWNPNDDKMMSLPLTPPPTTAAGPQWLKPTPSRVYPSNARSPK